MYSYSYIGVQTISTDDLTLVLGVHDRTVYDNDGRYLSIYLYICFPGFSFVDYFAFTACFRKVVGVSEILIYPKYNPENNPKDLALIKLAEKVETFSHMDQDSLIFCTKKGGSYLIWASLPSCAGSCLYRQQCLGLW